MTSGATAGAIEWTGIPPPSGMRLRLRTLTGRPAGRGYRRMLEDAGTGEFDVIVTESLDRIRRSIRNTAEFYGKANLHGITIHALNAALQGIVLSGLS